VSDRPNILFITSDQQHYDAMGYRNAEIKTPALDTLASEGTIFSRAYCVNPTCTPTRATMITGKYPSQHGAWSLGTKLPEGEHGANPPHHRLTQRPRAEADFAPWRESGQGNHGMHSHLHDRAELAKDIAIYYGMVSLMDKYIGRIVDRLDELGLAENTIVVFTTDHGHFYGHHGLVAKGPFHYEDMIRVPFVVRWPGHVPAGATSDAIQSLVDLPQSWLRLAGVDAPRTMTGVDQSDVWLGTKARARTWALVENRHEPTTIHLKTYVDDRYKLTVYYDRPYGELFDLVDDPGEIHNLWDSPGYQQLKNELVMKLLFVEMGKEPLWMPRIAGA
jgi:arylsulfatase A-like enzyme